MAMDIKCKLIQKFQEQRGNSARGAWCKEEFLVETIETYPRKICMSVWGEDKVSELGVYNVGEILIVSVNIESREFNGRWYTDVRVWRIQRDASALGVQTAQNISVNNFSASDDPFIGAGSDGEEDSDLPF